MLLFHSVAKIYTSRMKFRDITPFGVRFPTPLKEKIEKHAKENGRSMNSEIITTLDECYEGKKGGKDIKNFSTGDLLEELIRRVSAEGLTIQITKKQQEEPPESA